jgi:hypothetical protein
VQNTIIKASTRRSNTPLASSDSQPVFREVQRLPLSRVGVALAVPPLCMSGLLIWQVVLGHAWGKLPMSNGNIIGWTIFLWIIYLRLITVRLVTEVQKWALIVSLRGFWRSRRVPFDAIVSVESVTYDPARDYGGYGVRSTREGQAYLAGGTHGIRLTLANGEKLVVGSQRADELAGILSGTAK